MSPASTPRTRLPRNLWVVTATSFLNDISSEMLLNLLPLFLANVLGVRTGLIGLIEGVSEATASLLKVFSGWISDRLQRRKSLAVIGYALSTTAKPFVYLANSWGWVLGVRFADRLGKGIRTAPRDALVAETVDARHRGLAFGLHRAGDTAGAVIGLALALAILLRLQGIGAPLERSAFQVVVLVSLIPAVLAVLVLALGATEVSPSAGPSAPPRLSLAGFDQRFRVYLVIIALFTLGNSSDAFLILRAQDAGLSVPGILGMMITFNLVYALVSIPAGSLSDRVGRRRLLIAGWSLYAAVYFGFSRITAGWQAWALMGVYGTYYGLTEGAARAFVADLVPADRRGTAFGVYHAAIGLMAFPASLLAGILWQGIGGWAGLGPSAPFALGAVLALAAVVLLSRLRGPSAPQEGGHT